MVKKQKEALGALKWYRREGGDDARYQGFIQNCDKNTSLMFKSSRSLLLEELHGMESKLAGSSISFSEVAITFTFYLVNITFTF